MKIEMINEAFVCVTYFFVHVYTDATPSAKIRYDLGWIMIFLFFFMLAVNIYFLLSPNIGKIKQKFYAHCRKP